MDSDIILGIDLGTTNSVATYWDGKSYKIIKNKEKDTFPSIIEFTRQGKNISREDNENVIRNFKRVVGKLPTEPDTLKIIKDLNFNTNIEDDKILFFNPFEEKFYTIEELNSLILIRIKDFANKQLKTNVSKVVITIPAHFNQIQRESILVSAKLAGLNCIRLVNEPTAAAMSYGLNYHNDVNILIFDLGGGTFDLSILNIDEGFFEVLGTHGDNCLGGEDFTKVLVRDAINKFNSINKFYNIDQNILSKNISLLRNKCEELKVKGMNSFEIKDYYDDGKIKLDLKYQVNESEIKNLFNPLFEKITSYLDNILLLTNMSKQDLDHIILVGGATKSKDIKFVVESYFKKETLCNISPDLVVSIGAGILGFTINKPESSFSENIALVDVNPLSIGVESDDGMMTKIIKKGEKIPVTKYKYFTTEENNQKEVQIKIYQGERKFIKDNILIGNFILKDIVQKNKGEVVIKIEIGIDNNGVINVKASERGSNNNKSIKIENNNLINDHEMISKLILESEKYQNIDSYKHKLREKCYILQNQVQNLKFNCFDNVHINLTSEDKKELSNYIEKLEKKIESNIEPVKFIFDCKLEYKNIDIGHFEVIVNNLKKLIKLNEKRYPSMILNFEDTINTYEKEDNISGIKIDINNEYKVAIKEEINKVCVTIQNDENISNYSKNIIFGFINNLTYKLESVSLDYETYNENLDKLNKVIKQIIINDSQLINRYGNMEILKLLINKCDINIQVTKELSKIDLFNIIQEISTSNNINIDNLIN